MQASRANSVAIYVRISRDDNGENFETVENQRDLLLEYTKRHDLGKIHSVFIDDNVSGSAFDRRGLIKLKEAVLNGRINLLLLKDLSRLGRNNAKTLQWIDFLEENGIRILTADGRYDSLLDNDTLGIETWANERYVRDISRKIRASLRFKIQRGEYLGNAPFGYKKSECEKNRLVKDEANADTVKLIYRLYRAGNGYSAIASILNGKGLPSPGPSGWKSISVRRILLSRVYIGDTVQGVSEKISFKSKKTRRLPKEDWVITEGTHEGIVSKAEFMEVQRLRENKNCSGILHKSSRHILSGIIRCGRCGSSMYARKRTGGTAYVCGNYCRNGRSACTSHFIYEAQVVRRICDELLVLFTGVDDIKELTAQLEPMAAESYDPGVQTIKCRKQLESCLRQQEMLYRDRLEGRISEQLFERMNMQFEKRIKMLERQAKGFEAGTSGKTDAAGLICQAAERLGQGRLSNAAVRLAVGGITVYDPDDSSLPGFEGAERDSGSGLIVIDFRF